MSNQHDPANCCTPRNEKLQSDLAISSTLYHVAPSDRRDSILRHGLSIRFSALYVEGDALTGAVFLTDTKPEHGHSGLDVWEVDATGLELAEDWTTEPVEGERWFGTGDVPADRLTLLELQPSCEAEPPSAEASRSKPSLSM